MYDCYKGETVTAEQTAALKRFISHPDWIKNARDQVEAYYRDRPVEDEEDPQKDNIFHYVKPVYIFVKRDKSCPRVALMCEYRYDPEHGLAIVFSADGHVAVGQQDIIL